MFKDANMFYVTLFASGKTRNINVRMFKGKVVKIFATDHALRRRIQAGIGDGSYIPKPVINRLIGV